VQKTFKATAEFKLDRDVQNKLEAEAKVTDIMKKEITDKIKQAIETQSNVNVVERDGRLFTGSALKTTFCLLSLFSPDSALLGGSEKINVPFAGPVSFFGFMQLGPIVLIGLRVYLQI
jgi:hypothetical protein